jgi:glycosyltransferase involved in cell wall biosynthesis
MTAAPVGTNSESPLVSVLTPSFNQGRFIGDCIASVQKQTYSQIEHIVCDGASTDGTQEILRSAPPTVRWVSEPDRGQSHALNKAFQMSQGEIIGWLNSDDAYFQCNAVADAVAFLARRPDVDVVYGHAALVSADGLVLHVMWVPPFSYRFLRFANFIVQPAVFMRRTAVGGTLVDEEFGHSMDRELWLRLGRDRRFARVDSILAIDRHQELRKVYTRADLATADRRILAARYGISPPSRFRVARKLYTVAARLIGVRLLRRATRGLAFDGYIDRPSRLFARQVAVARGAMPYEHGARKHE